MITIRYADLLLTILTGCVLVMTTLVVAGYFRLRRSLERLEARGADLARLGGDLEALVERADGLVAGLHQASALVAGAKAGIAALRRSAS